MTTPTSQPTTLERFEQLDPMYAAVVESGGRVWLRGELRAASHRLAHALRRAGLRSGDAFAVIAPNCAEYLAAFFAALHGGLYLVPINWHLSWREIAGILSDSRAKALIVHKRCSLITANVVRSEPLAPSVLISIGNLPGFIEFEDFIAGYSSAPPAPSAPGSIMAFTSATTGRAKGVRRLRADINFWPHATNPAMPAPPSAAPDQVHLCNSMLYHAPVLYLCGAQLAQGQRLVLCDGWDPGKALRLIDTHLVTNTFMVPTMFVRLLKLPEVERRQFNISSLEVVLHSAAPCPVDVKRAMIDWWGPILWERYGSVEGPVTLVDSHDWLRYPGTVGRPEPDVDVKILDDDGAELPPGQVGAIYVSPRQGFEFEYFGDPGKTAANRRARYYTVGDLGYVNDAGFLFLCDRRANLIISGGMNIYPAEIEQLLIQHPAVADCAVFAMPHEILGEVPGALVQLAPGIEAEPRLQAELLGFLRARLATIKLPNKIRFVDRLPRDPNGKLYKRLLRDAA
jgi:long-chain acyl-CoA synthetase